MRVSVHTHHVDVTCDEQDDVSLDAENALLKAVDDAKRVAEAGEPEEEDE